ncbi:cysteine proteinase [Testicularia cyperi]|uniref:Ubiquitin carboxyl-terminal hydrolase n=1 Tax=Testicularia cyperi TaxID=1882483 RepID=A0A317XWA0_9BASI|nr:cysteine proteinase [Testicularia cyperi]
MTSNRFVLVHPPARLAYPLFGCLPFPLTIPVQILLSIGVILLVVIASAIATDMFKPGLQAASLLHPFSSPSHSIRDSPLASLRRAQSSTLGADHSLPNTSALLPGSKSTSVSNGEIRESAQHAQPSIANPKYKGLRNTGNTCFFNSTLQAISALPSFHQYLRALIEEAERWDTPTPVIDALTDLIDTLLAPSDRNATINPVQLVRALQDLPSSSIRSLVGAHQQQDAHELFALLNEAIDAEAKVIQDERHIALNSEHAGLKTLMAPSLPWGGKAVRSAPLQSALRLPSLGSSASLSNLAQVASGKGFGKGLAAGSSSETTSLISPFDALLAQRTTCLDCGYCEAIRHYSTSEISLSVPSPNVRTRTSQLTGTSACSLEECLAMWSGLEQVDWICWNCSLRSTLASIRADLASKTGPARHGVVNGKAHLNGNGSSSGGMTASKKKRLAQLKAKEAKVARILESGLSEDEAKQESDDPGSPLHNVLNNVQLTKAMSRLSTKQIMLSRPPRTLALHLNRSSYSASSWAPAKNNRHVLFDEYLDLSAVTLNGSIQIDGSIGMNRSGDGQIPNGGDGSSNARYRLAAIVVHYGSHSFGHYVAFKRISSDSSSSSLAGIGQDTHDNSGSGDAWLRLSDESVTRATLKQVLSENPFMLFYEQLPPAFAPNGLERLHVPNDASYADLQRAISNLAESQHLEDASSVTGGLQPGSSPAPDSATPTSSMGSIRIRPRIVHRWHPPPLHT